MAPCGSMTLPRNSPVPSLAKAGAGARSETPRNNPPTNFKAFIARASYTELSAPREVEANRTRAAATAPREARKARLDSRTRLATRAAYPLNEFRRIHADIKGGLSV